MSSLDCRSDGLRSRIKLLGTDNAVCSASAAATLLLPLCRDAKSSRREAEEARTPACQGSGGMPARCMIWTGSPRTKSRVESSRARACASRL